MNRIQNHACQLRAEISLRLPSASRRFSPRSMVQVIAFVVCAFFPSGPRALAATPETSTTRPHIVLFLSDDHGQRDSGIYGSSIVRTPNLDRIAKAGLRFTHAFVGSPTCTPSRAILFSGLTSVHNGAQANHTYLQPNVKTLPQYLAPLGYRLAHFGKGHIQPRSQYAPLEFVGGSMRRNAKFGNLELNAEVVERWMQDHSKKKDAAPACLIVGSFRPHVPWPTESEYDPAKVDLPPTLVDTPETRRYRALYYSDVTAMDRLVGKVYDAAHKHLGDNVLFIYTSDHGPQWPFGKWNLYDAGIHVPLVATWPGVIEQGEVTEAMVNSPDLLPTLVEIAGGEAPENIDGKSYARVLRGKRKSHREHVFSTHSGDGDMNVFPMRSVRTARFKYIRNLRPEFKYTTHIDRAHARDGRGYFDSWVAAAGQGDELAAAAVARYHRRPAEELYDVVADPHEQTNLAGVAEHEATLRQLRSLVDGWMKEQGDEGRVFGTPQLPE